MAKCEVWVIAGATSEMIRDESLASRTSCATLQLLPQLRDQNDLSYNGKRELGCD
jgi:hypothetical protein